jgi:hypothetical protein
MQAARRTRSPKRIAVIMKPVLALRLPRAYRAGQRFPEDPKPPVPRPEAASSASSHSIAS